MTWKDIKFLLIMFEYLCIINIEDLYINFLAKYVDEGNEMTGFMTLKEASEKWGICARRINTLCVEGRIEGAHKLGNMWVLPADSEKPKDERIKTGKYVKKKQR